MTIDYSKIPPATRETIDAWIESGRPTGDFVKALLSNDLRGAFARADESNIEAMFHTVAYLWNNAPGSCWGSPDALELWERKHKQQREAANAAIETK